MIISVSRRTDIPNYYSKWFINRIQEEYVLVRNPFNTHQVSKIDLSPEAVDCIVFWSKNPNNMLDKLHLLRDYKYYFQFTITSYSNDIEKNIKNDDIFNTFMRLSDLIGCDKVVWRYDPIIITDKYTIDYHKKYFEKMAKILSNYTDLCVISFLDIYKKVLKNMRDINLYDINEYAIMELSKFISDVANFCNIRVSTCCENYDLSQFGIIKGKCIDDDRISNILGFNIKSKKDRNQREYCGCIESYDRGAYNTCLSHCIYCYANYSQDKVKSMTSMYNEKSPILCDTINNKDIIKSRKS